MSQQVHFLFYSRLDEEKGIELVLGAIKRFAQEKETRVRVSLFGDGSRRGAVEACIEELPDFPIAYYGRQPKQEIFSFMMQEKVDVVLMPSLFLETFGLSSGEALWHGIPVIGFDKGGTSQFLLDEHCSIGSYRGVNDEERLFHAMKYFLTTLDEKSRYKYRQLSLQRALRYSRKEWKAVFSSILSSSLGICTENRLNVLIVSDYITRIAGIESHIYEVRDILQEQGYKVDIFGGNIYAGWLRKVGLLATIGNLWEAGRLWWAIYKSKPDLIYRNSIHRYLGWLPLWIGTRRVKDHQKVHHIVMYHDFGLFHPFPSNIYDERQLQYENSFKGFFVESRKHTLRKPILWCKYISLVVIRRILGRKVSIHLVPSDYMVPLISRFYPKGTTIRTLPNMVA